MTEMIRNGNRICGRMCVELLGSLLSPMSIGSGESQQTDGDVVQNAAGKPFIPGSTVAGILRDYSRVMLGKERTEQLFGMEKGGIPGSEADRQSRIFCYDACLEQAELMVRDGVRLGESKTAIPQSKYELQAVERGARFRLRLELIQRKDCLHTDSEEPEVISKALKEAWKEEEQAVRTWITGFQSGELRIGAKSRRGFGKVNLEQARVLCFNMTKKEEYRRWLEWDWDNSDAFSEAKDLETEGSERTPMLEEVLEIPLKIPYTLIIRNYNGTLGKNGDADYEHLTVSQRKEQAVIPGSSFAGAFRSYLAKLTASQAGISWKEAQKRLQPYFGTWTEENPKKLQPYSDTWTEENQEKLTASKVVFEETLIKGGHRLPITRTAIDRFTGGTVSGALFEEVPWVGGTTTLCIRWKKAEDSKENAILCGLLLFAVYDLWDGFLTVGGETAVGRGIFCKPDEEDVEIKWNGKSLASDKAEEFMKMALGWMKG